MTSTTTSTTTPSTDGFSARLQAANEETWRAAVQHRFVDELLEGSVPDDVLRHYLVQDYQFFDAFVAMIGQAIASAPDLPARLPLARQLGMLAADEDGYFEQSFDTLDVPEGDRISPELSPATVAFDRVMRDAIQTRSYAAVLAVLTVAEWLYLDWATRPEAEQASTRPEHLGWVDLHRGEAYETWTLWLRGQLDAHEPTDPAEKAQVEELFARAVACEVAFFDDAYAAV
ncbi:TenA family protein [Ornithinimicrobium sp. Y1847]|uniref:TenA family protein n=1 Tax=Ornithinimicrobium sp. Y1847 TaxID=3405419 RepID=UPI003B677C58